jgi:aspartyl/asparaginyl-tRNA synthetase
MAFCNLEDDMSCAEDYVRYCCKHLLEACRGDLEFINSMIDKGAIARLEQVASTPFRRLPYTEAIEILEGVVARGEKKFEFPVKWGIDLQVCTYRFFRGVVSFNFNLIFYFSSNFNFFISWVFYLHSSGSDCLPPPPPPKKNKKIKKIHRASTSAT